MMHGREKSDSSIVAKKPANKAKIAAAELVERRACPGLVPGEEAKGNTGQQSMFRTQSRVGMSQALERVRENGFQPFRRQIPEAGAVCGNSARTDLCGGRWVTSVPTAILWTPPGLQGYSTVMPGWVRSHLSGLLMQFHLNRGT